MRASLPILVVLFLIGAVSAARFKSIRECNGNRKLSRIGDDFPSDHGVSALMTEYVEAININKPNISSKFFTTIFTCGGCMGTITAVEITDLIGKARKEFCYYNIAVSFPRTGVALAEINIGYVKVEFEISLETRLITRGTVLKCPPKTIRPPTTLPPTTMESASTTIRSPTILPPTTMESASTTIRSPTILPPTTMESASTVIGPPFVAHFNGFRGCNGSWRIVRTEGGKDFPNDLGVSTFLKDYVEQIDITKPNISSKFFTEVFPCGGCMGTISAVEVTDLIGKARKEFCNYNVAVSFPRSGVAEVQLTIGYVQVEFEFSLEKRLITRGAVLKCPTVIPSQPLPTTLPPPKRTYPPPVTMLTWPKDSTLLTTTTKKYPDVTLYTIEPL